MTKKGAMTRMRTMPCPQNGWSSRIASSTPRTTVMTSTPPTITKVACTLGQKELEPMKRT